MMSQPRSEAVKAAAKQLAALPPLRQMADELRFYPVSLLAELCDLHAERGGPVPDHVLTLLPYLGETALRALVEGGFLEMLDDVSYAIRAYSPTESGRKLAASVRPPAKQARKKRS